MLTHIPRRRILAAALIGAALAALGVTIASSHAAGARPGAKATDLPVANMNTPSGYFLPVGAGTGYGASLFPIPLRITVSGPGWGAAQWKTTSHGKPAFGWVALARPPLGDPHGDLLIETAFGSTASVADTIARLRVGGSHLPDSNVGGVTFHAVTPVEVAGYSGRQFDGEVWGKFGKVLIPFSAITHGASPTDSIRFEQGEVFRVVALDVRGKTVVIFVESWKLPAEQFPAFLGTARKLLAGLRFPMP